MYVGLSLAAQSSARMSGGVGLINSFLSSGAIKLSCCTNLQGQRQVLRQNLSVLSRVISTQQPPLSPTWPTVTAGISTPTRRSLSIKSTSPTLLKDTDDPMTLATTVQDTKETSVLSRGHEGSSSPPGSKAFVECDREALIDLFNEYAKHCDTNGCDLDRDGLASILKAVGENADEDTVNHLFDLADESGDDLIQLDEFLRASDILLGSAPARIVLLVGGPGSGKGVLSKRLEKECGVVHLSSGELLRDEVARDTVLGRQVKEIMARGELVSSAVIVTLMRRVMRNYPGKRVLLDGFPRSLQNAHDLVELCGKPELALHLTCDDTILMERIIARGQKAAEAAAVAEGGDSSATKRADDNFHTALKRLRTYHTYHHSTMEWLQEQHIPVVNLDCSGTPDDVWSQLVAIGRLMRPATRIPANSDDVTGNGNTSSDVLGGTSNGSSDNSDQRSIA